MRITTFEVIGKVSLSARRAWIEISVLALGMPTSVVALRKESVDRNTFALQDRSNDYGSRSPQGERG